MGYCISVCIEKGGVGKTVTVCNLAALMAQDGKRVIWMPRVTVPIP